MHVTKLKVPKHLSIPAVMIAFISLCLVGIALVAGILIYGYYQDNPSVSYSLKTVDCRQQTITENGAWDGACLIVITATNNENRAIDMDYLSVGGGPGFGSKEPKIRIYSGDTTFCYGVNPFADEFTAHQIKDISLVCGGTTSITDPNNASDKHPTKITIQGRNTTALMVTPNLLQE